MANQEHLDILKQGVDVWNRWRIENQDRRPNLCEANLSGANLMAANFNGADLSGSILIGANLVGARLSEANLSQASLTWANLSVAFLRETNFSGANLAGVNFNGALLTGPNFSQARITMAQFGNVDLRTIQGWDTVNNLGPSTIGIDTIFRSGGHIPETFLRTAGVPDSLIKAIPSLISSLSPIDFYSCFISYSSKDQEFAERLHADLLSKGVHCWFAPEDLKIGEKFWHRIDESIRVYDKLMVVLSQHSVESEWVEREVVSALEKEGQQQKLVLFPITLDEAFKHASAPWAANIRRTRHIGDFRNWKKHNDYQRAFNRLLRDLKAQS